jgi:predicted  nucleic acid-binding Zn-ribbon protein
LSIGGSTEPKDLIEVIRNDLDAVREKIAKLEEKRHKIDITDPIYMIMSQEITALTNKEVALTNEKVELMKEKALAGMARNYLS